MLAAVDVVRVEYLVVVIWALRSFRHDFVCCDIGAEVFFAVTKAVVILVLEVVEVV